eukprot:7148535-Prymnesium_polylepis.1
MTAWETLAGVGAPNVWWCRNERMPSTAAWSSSTRRGAWSSPYRLLFVAAQPAEVLGRLIVLPVSHVYVALCTSFLLCLSSMASERGVPIDANIKGNVRSYPRLPVLNAARDLVLCDEGCEV